ncbi:hypothetical protein FIA58_009105 [Flavobacterium jejuense]|uniref:Uncharacterized protein n=1 Tax=Flavobacterium jejuense TaxID=1544455 RepID=A0ABX0IVK9_9FLAO|nr:hypothetical protein [Flavobacterium jejuense]NHN25830.1 hypothetical protein [Flavobacterium jejuense]
MEKKRHTCILCKKKRFQEHMKSFIFVSWVTPVKKSRVKHWACNKNKNYFEPTCIEELLKTDFNPVIMP